VYAVVYSGEKGKGFANKAGGLTDLPVESETGQNDNFGTQNDVAF
jgi:hypothetical protein